jgi:hypothetical protein
MLSIQTFSLRAFRCWTGCFPLPDEMLLLVCGAVFVPRAIVRTSVTVGRCLLKKPEAHILQLVGIELYICSTLTLFLTYSPYFERNERRVMRSPCCLSVCSLVSVHLSMYPPKFLGLWNHLALCPSVCVSPTLILLGGLWDYLAVCGSVYVSPWFISFSMRSVSYQGGLWDHLAICVSMWTP